jgi:hypothetical protein
LNPLIFIDMKTLSPLQNLYVNLLIILRNFMFYFPKISELARDFPVSWKKCKILNIFIPGKKVREK